MPVAAQPEWGDLTAAQQIAECEWIAEVLLRSRNAPECAGDVRREADFWTRLAAEIKAASQT